MVEGITRDQPEQEHEEHDNGMFRNQEEEEEKNHDQEYREKELEVISMGIRVCH